jgi:hypothetical protein
VIFLPDLDALVEEEDKEPVLDEVSSQKSQEPLIEEDTKSTSLPSIIGMSIESITSKASSKAEIVSIKSKNSISSAPEVKSPPVYDNPINISSIQIAVPAPEISKAPSTTNVARAKSISVVSLATPIQEAQGKRLFVIYRQPELKRLIFGKELYADCSKVQLEVLQNAEKIQRCVCVLQSLSEEPVVDDQPLSSIVSEEEIKDNLSVSESIVESSKFDQDSEPEEKPILERLKDLFGNSEDMPSAVAWYFCN